MEDRLVLLEAIGGGDLSCPALIEAIVRGGVEGRHLLLPSSMQAKEVAEHERELRASV